MADEGMDLYLVCNTRAAAAAHVVNSTNSTKKAPVLDLNQLLVSKPPQYAAAHQPGFLVETPILKKLPTGSGSRQKPQVGVVKLDEG